MKTEWQRQCEEALKRYPDFGTYRSSPPTSCARAREAWFVVRTATNREAAAEEALREIGLEVYCPRSMHWRRHARRKETVRRVLIPGYLFVMAGPQDFAEIWAADGVSGMLGGELPPALAPSDVRLLTLIREAEAAGEFDETRTIEKPEKARAERKGKKRKRGDVGDRVRLTAAGLFDGQLGQIIERLSDYQLRVLLDGMHLPITVAHAEVTAA